MIELENVAYNYGGAELFSQVSLTLSAGSFHFLTGPSGAGKTTLLKLCYGALQATAGQVRLFGDDAARMDRDAVALSRRRIGVVHQDCQFLDHLNVSDNIALPLTVSGRDAEAAGNLGDLIGWVGLCGQADQLPPELSGGERQRAALARAVIMSPDVIIADEPTSSLDATTQATFLQLLFAQSRGHDTTLLMVSHDARLSSQFDRVIQMADIVQTVRGGA